METLLTVIVTWLSVNYGLPSSYELPEVRMIDQGAMIEVRAAVLGAEEAAQLREAVDQGNGFVAFYDDTDRTVYLPEDWSAASPADVSVLVHEMVHHLQNVGNVSHECEEARERPAYRAQAQWLEFAGTTLENEFEIDPMTMLVLTNCWY